MYKSQQCQHCLYRKCNCSAWTLIITCCPASNPNIHGVKKRPGNLHFHLKLSFLVGVGEGWFIIYPILNICSYVQKESLPGRTIAEALICISGLYNECTTSFSNQDNSGRRRKPGQPGCLEAEHCAGMASSEQCSAGLLLPAQLHQLTPLCRTLQPPSSSAESSPSHCLLFLSPSMQEALAQDLPPCFLGYCLRHCLHQIGISIFAWRPDRMKPWNLG